MKKSALLLSAAVLAISACAAHPAPISTSQTEAVAAVARSIDVYKSPTCTCCHEWEAYLRARGYTVRSFASDDISAIKDSHRIPTEAWSCHTAVIGGYFVEGHVPIEAIEDLLAQRPAIDGISLPQMPAGSPGMPGVQAEPFQILAVQDGVTSAFGAY